MEDDPKVNRTTRHPVPPKAKRSSGETKIERNVRTEGFRVWLAGQVGRDRRSLHAIEVEADIRGNALGKFLRGERGGQQGLTPLMLRKLAPVLLISEIELLTRAGHLHYEPWHVPVLEAVAADPLLDGYEKIALLISYDRFIRDRSEEG